jgi:tetratricopeptide (TPR) repeat protein
MRRLVAGILTGLFLISYAVSQAPVDSVAYNPGIQLIGKAKTEGDYVSAARYFEQLAARQPGQWVALYYIGLSYIHASNQAPEDETKDALLDKAQPILDKAFKLKPGDPELYVLQAFLYQSRIQVNPQLRGLTYSQKAEASLKKAQAKDPGNPRAYTLMGYNVYFTPVLFGGGPKNALPHFLKAQGKYRIFKPELSFYPHWGEQENEKMIRECQLAIK